MYRNIWHKNPNMLDGKQKKERLEIVQKKELERNY